ncbi:hypothetical protein [Halobellus rubicundus]|uniref:Uncharacterized protein n=1 Tax=Halobellus rubicundus TaxID=2996466 RepID=A0ABD5MDV4_9EURY
MSQQFRVVDHVERETAEYLEKTGATLAHDEDITYVLEEIDDGDR